ncbi:allene oxide cyclase barrel-like domain-containing protein [Actinocrispum wychmicini]|uniref:Allene oxide cyclase barrel-like domain-containing protein n=1 Tax=Actinocrispum wychmicini TaxID=1213861 RepID=A0A4R2JL81_9PSEU|nr:hypothetical protein [Actinocrispum wychmicini]TCO60813.1 hypothetical protein EV192_103394 [Actinocrispum wychmicini]
MRFSSRRLTGATVLGAACVLVSLAAGASAASDPQPGAAGHGCVVVDNVTEQTIRHESVGAGGLGMHVGDAATFYDNIYDGNSNTVVGNVVGIVGAVSTRPSDGHLMTHYTDDVLFPDGAIRADGIADRNLVLTGKPVRYPAVGLTGRYAGKYGYREWNTIIPQTPPTNPGDIRIQLKMVLCG